MCAGMENKVNAIFNENRSLSSFYMPEDEFRQRLELYKQKKPFRERT